MLTRFLLDVMRLKWCEVEAIVSKRTYAHTVHSVTLASSVVRTHSHSHTHTHTLVCMNWTQSE